MQLYHKLKTFKVNYKHTKILPQPSRQLTFDDNSYRVRLRERQISLVFMCLNQGYRAGVSKYIFLCNCYCKMGLTPIYAFCCCCRFFQTCFTYYCIPDWCVWTSSVSDKQPFIAFLSMSFPFFKSWRFVTKWEGSYHSLLTTWKYMGIKLHGEKKSIADMSSL